MTLTEVANGGIEKLQTQLFDARVELAEAQAQLLALSVFCAFLCVALYKSIRRR